MTHSINYNSRKIAIVNFGSLVLSYILCSLFPRFFGCYLFSCLFGHNILLLILCCLHSLLNLCCLFGCFLSCCMFCSLLIHNCLFLFISCCNLCRVFYFRFGLRLYCCFFISLGAINMGLCSICSCIVNLFPIFVPINSIFYNFFFIV